MNTTTIRRAPRPSIPQPDSGSDGAFFTTLAAVLGLLVLILYVALFYGLSLSLVR